MHPQHVLRDHSVTLLVRVVRDDEEQIESGQERVGQSDIAVGIFVNVVLRDISLTEVSCVCG